MPLQQARYELPNRDLYSTQSAGEKQPVHVGEGEQEKPLWQKNRVALQCDNAFRRSNDSNYKLDKQNEIKK